MGLVGEHAGRTDLGEVAGEFGFQRAIFGTTEVDVRSGAEYAQVGAVGVILVVADAAIARDAAVHLMADERAEILIQMRSLVEPVRAAEMTLHHLPLLTMTMTP